MFKALLIEDKKVFISISRWGAANITIDFGLFSSRHDPDCFTEMAKWANPRMALSSIAATALEVLDTIGWSTERLCISAESRRMKVYERIARRKGYNTEIVDVKGDVYLFIKKGE